jgi:signal transduction histidine kinase/ActR/RegA family two-component response regulator/putative methionine-R-sulfoxide reductase with GAF domain
LNALQNINQLIVRCKNKDQLLQDACDILVQTRGYRMVWIGLLNEGRQVRPAARAGEGTNYLDRITVTYDEQKTGKGPTGLAMRDRRPSVVADIATDPGYALWREAALSHGFLSSASVPMLHNGQISGTLNVYSGSTNAFDAEEINLLQELAADLAFAMVSIEEEARREKAERELRESQRFLQSTLDALTSHIAILDHQGTIIAVNTAWRQLGVENGFVSSCLGIGTNYLDICDKATGDWSQGAPSAAAGIRAIIAGTSDSFCQEYPCHSPTENRWFTMRVTRFSGEGPVRVVVAHENITARKQAEEELRAARDEMEQRVAERTEALAEANSQLQRASADAEQARAEAERANAAKSEFLSRMSHELRTPLNSILGFAQLMEMDAHTEDDRETVGMILTAGQHLLELINEVLDIARIESGRFSLETETLSLTDTLRETIDLVRPLATQRNITLNIGDCQSQRILADAQRIKQVFLNLLSNAIKYNREGGTVVVTCAPGGIGRLRVTIADTGSGIAPGQQHKLFTPFERLDAAKSGVEGTGLGLSLCKRLVELMGGAIGAESELGTGSTFWIELPLADEHHQNNNGLPAIARQVDSSVEHPVIELPKRSVLHIEDNLSNLQLIEKILARQLNVRLMTAMQGSIGLQLARDHHPDLVLLDLNLPDMDGSEVLQRLREEPALREVPVVVVSADALTHQVERLKRLGARHYLTKPLNVRQFLDVMQEILEPEKQ